MRTVALMIAKKESKRLPDKNFRDFCGKPMFVWNLEKCLDLFDEVYVSSDSDFILEESKKLGACPIKRPVELCKSDVPNIDVYQHAFEHMDNPDGIVAVKADSPTTRSEIIQQTKELMERYGYNEIMTTYPIRGYEPKNCVYGSVWALSRERLENYLDAWNPEPELLIVDDAVDIHTEEDFKKAEAQLLARQK
ncbi:MAG: hypothetical protein HYT31_00785 [Parcubacteria group bacterium]|nr:hypothetical protein [Parcubacteria group bacterium]